MSWNSEALGCGKCFTADKRTSCEYPEKSSEDISAVGKTRMHELQEAQSLASTSGDISNVAAEPAPRCSTAHITYIVHPQLIEQQFSKVDFRICSFHD